jgi:hypothetical protein
MQLPEASGPCDHGGMTTTLGIFVQSHAGREPVLNGLRSSLEASDVGIEYTVMMHPPGHTVVEHFLAVLAAMRDADTDLVLRLEDDAVVNRHVRHNLTTWPAIHRPDFGAGWAMSPPLSVLDWIYRKRVRNPSRKRLIPVCAAVMFWRRDMEWVIAGCERWFAHHGGNAMDFAMSAAVHDEKKQNYLHDPCVADHRVLGIASTLSHTHKSSSTAAGAYNQNWKRA